MNSLNIHLCGLVHVLLFRCLFRKVVCTNMFESANSLFNYRNLQIEYIKKMQIRRFFSCITIFFTKRGPKSISEKIFLKVFKIYLLEKG